MNLKKCPKCGNIYPNFFTHCVDCGEILVAETKKAGKTSTYLKIELVLCVSIILVIFVFIPSIQYSERSGRDFSETVSAISAAELQSIAEFPLNQPVTDNNFQITVNSARNGQITYNSNKFFLVTVFFKNVRTSGNIKISTDDFELIDSTGRFYSPYAIGSQVSYDLSPLQGYTNELTFIIPENATAKKIRFIFPHTSIFASNRDFVEFVI